MALTREIYALTEFVSAPGDAAATSPLRRPAILVLHHIRAGFDSGWLDRALADLRLPESAAVDRPAV